MCMPFFFFGANLEPDAKEMMKKTRANFGTFDQVFGVLSVHSVVHDSTAIQLAVGGLVEAKPLRLDCNFQSLIRDS